MNHYYSIIDTNYDERDSANWTENENVDPFVSTWQEIDPFESFESCLWDDAEV